MYIDTCVYYVSIYYVINLISIINALILYYLFIFCMHVCARTCMRVCEKRLIYQHLMLQLILQAFELSFHPTMPAIRHLRTFLIDLNVLCLSN